MLASDFGFYRIATASPVGRIADPAFNARKLIECAIIAAQNEAAVVLFPELFLTEYTCEDLFHTTKLLEDALDALRNKNRHFSAIDGRATRHVGYEISGRKRERIEEIYGWLKGTILRRVHFRGLKRVGFVFKFAVAACSCNPSEGNTRRVESMRKNYDLKKMKWKPNPYLKLLKRPVTIRFDQDVIEYFKSLSEAEGVPYQTLMNQFLRYCVENHFKPKMDWRKAS